MWVTLISLVFQFESFHHTPYFDRTQFSYGYGTKASEQMCITKDFGEKLAINELKKHFALVDEIDGLTDNQKAALISLSYNIGSNAFRTSTLYKLVKQGEMCRASQEFDRWIYQNGKPLRGLKKRRTAERKLFLDNLKC